jgi:chromosome segregation ATPase
MENEKYLKYYVETLTGVMTDAIIKNVSFQANARINEDIIREQADEIAKYQVMIADVNQDNDGKLEQHQQIIDELNETLKKKIEEHQNTINDYNNRLSDYHNIKNEHENVKQQVSHVNTFRNELIKEREEHQKTRDSYENKIKELNDKIEYLQLTPAKRKKIDDAKNVKVETKEVNLFQEAESTTIKDGGSF